LNRHATAFRAGVHLNAVNSGSLPIKSALDGLIAEAPVGYNVAFIGIKRRKRLKLPSTQRIPDFDRGTRVGSITRSHILILDGTPGDVNCSAASRSKGVRSWKRSVSIRKLT